MGIKPGWKKILIETYKHCFSGNLPDDTKITEVIDDLSLNIRNLIVDREATWDSFATQLRNRIQYHRGNPDLRKYIVVIDESQYVPRSKECTQRNRDKKEIPFTEVEIEAMLPLEGFLFHTPTKQFLTKVMATRAMHCKMYDFCTGETALAKLPQTNVELIIDGGYTEYMKYQQKEGKPFVILDKTDSNETKVQPNNTSGQCYTTITPRKEEQDYAKVIIYPSRKIGEGDLKIPRAISELEQGNIFIKSRESDSIFILLLHMRGWINRETGSIKYGVFLELEFDPKGSSDTSRLDVVSLWRTILLHFQTDYPGISCPIETFVLLVLLAGSDYTDGFPQLGPAKIWESFKDYGHKILFDHSTELVDMKSDTKTNGRENAIITDYGYGDPKCIYGYSIAEDKVFSFIACMYCRYVAKEKNIRSSNKIDMGYIRKLAKEQDVKKTDSHKWNIPSDEEIKAKIRRIYWTLDYWTNTSKNDAKLKNREDREHGYLIPFVKEPKTGHSKYGWDIFEQENPDDTKRRYNSESNTTDPIFSNDHKRRKTIVRPATRVHRYTQKN